MQPCLGPDVVLVALSLILQMAAILVLGILPTVAGRRKY